MKITGIGLQNLLGILKGPYHKNYREFFSESLSRIAAHPRLQRRVVYPWRIFARSHNTGISVFAPFLNPKLMMINPGFSGWMPRHILLGSEITGGESPSVDLETPSFKSLTPFEVGFRGTAADYMQDGCFPQDIRKEVIGYSQLRFDPTFFFHGIKPIEMMNALESLRTAIVAKKVQLDSTVYGSFFSGLDWSDIQLFMVGENQRDLCKIVRALRCLTLKDLGDFKPPQSDWSVFGATTTLYGVNASMYYGALSSPHSFKKGIFFQADLIVTIRPGKSQNILATLKRVKFPSNLDGIFEFGADQRDLVVHLRPKDPSAINTALAVDLATMVKLERILFEEHGRDILDYYWEMGHDTPCNCIVENSRRMIQVSIPDEKRMARVFRRKEDWSGDSFQWGFDYEDKWRIIPQPTRYRLELLEQDLLKNLQDQSLLLDYVDGLFSYHALAWRLQRYATNPPNEIGRIQALNRLLETLLSENRALMFQRTRANLYQFLEREWEPSNPLGGLGIVAKAASSIGSWMSQKAFLAQPFKEALTRFRPIFSLTSGSKPEIDMDTSQILIPESQGHRLPQLGILIVEGASMGYIKQWVELLDRQIFTKDQRGACTINVARRHGAFIKELRAIAGKPKNLIKVMYPKNYYVKRNTWHHAIASTYSCRTVYRWNRAHYTLAHYFVLESERKRHINPCNGEYLDNAKKKWESIRNHVCMRVFFSWIMQGFFDGKDRLWGGGDDLASEYADHVVTFLNSITEIIGEVKAEMLHLEGGLFADEATIITQWLSEAVPTLQQFLSAGWEMQLCIIHVLSEISHFEVLEDPEGFDFENYFVGSGLPPNLQKISPPELLSRLCLFTQIRAKLKQNIVSLIRMSEEGKDEEFQESFDRLRRIIHDLGQERIEAPSSNLVDEMENCLIQLQKFPHQTSKDILLRALDAFDSTILKANHRTAIDLWSYTLWAEKDALWELKAQKSIDLKFN